MKIPKIKHNYVRFILATFVVIVLAVAGYIYKYQQLVNEGSVIADERCLTVDPVLELKQDKALEYYQVLPTLTDPSEVQALSDSLIPYFQDTVDVSGPWLKKQKAFIDRWDFTFFTHDDLEEVFYAQYDKYEADYDSNILMIRYIKALPDKSLEDDLIAAIEKQGEMQDVLDEKVKIAERRSDFRYYFITVPKSKCPDSPFENPSIGRDNLALLQFIYTTI